VPRISVSYVKVAKLGYYSSMAQGKIYSPEEIAKIYDFFRR
jgi:hypothetical protein